MRLTDHFTLDELTHSDTAVRLGIDNTPGQTVRDNLQTLAHGLESVRAALGGKPIVISSGYRSPLLNERIGGSVKSLHMVGLAADFTCPAFGTPREVAEHLAGLADSLCFDQLILEYERWVHISFPGYACTPRKEVLTAVRGQGYVQGLA